MEKGVNKGHIKKVINEAVLKDDLDKGTKEPNMFECLICHGLVFNPYVCSFCTSNLYCNHCI